MLAIQYFPSTALNLFFVAGQRITLAACCYNKVEQLFVQVIEIHKTKLGEEHSDTLMSMANPAPAWEFASRKANAIRLLRNCVAKQRLILGPAQPDLVGCVWASSLNQ